MKKSTAFLTLAGVFALTGCTTKVMDDRYYETPKDDAGRPVQAAPASVADPAPLQPEPERVPLKTGKAGTYAPMTVQAADRIGLDDNAAPRTKAGSRKGSVSAGGTYVVKPHDTMGKIAQRHRVSLSALLSANNMTEKDARRLRIGQKLVIPGGKGAVKAAVSQKNAGKERKSAGTAAPAAAAALNADGTYTVRRGDNIPKIARKFGVRARAIQEANSLSDEATRRLQIGQKLIIPAGSAAVKSGKVSAPAKPQTAVDSGANPPPPPEEKSPAPAPAAAGANAGNAAPAAAPAPAPDSGVVSADTATEFLSVGDAKTLAEFAAKHGTTVEKLRQLNTSHAGSDKLEPGEYLFVPAGK